MLFPAVEGPILSALLPIDVLGDGNCCLHAVSLALWGIQDRESVLRRAMTGMIQSKAKFFVTRYHHSAQAVVHMENAS